MTINPKAVYALYSNAVKTMGDKAFDSDGNEITLNTTNINNWVDPNAYVDKRLAEYPSIGEQLDMIYHAGQGGDAFQAAIQAVKDKYPKG
jgi:hypothetical protein